MNAPFPFQSANLNVMPPSSPPDEREIDVLEYWDIIVDSRWLIAGVVVLFGALAAGYVGLTKPVYESNLLIQVEDSAASAKSFLGETASLFDIKTPATAEIEILRSRMVIGAAVDRTLDYVEARPKYLPVIGNWLARHATSLSQPGILGMGGWVTGTERIQVAAFDVPKDVEGSPFQLLSLGSKRFRVHHPQLLQDVIGTVGTPLSFPIASGMATLTVTALEGAPGAIFVLQRNSRLQVVESLQERLKLSEKGRQSGVIEATLRDSDAVRLTNVLNAIGQQYVRQNLERKAAEAEKTLAFLAVQLPQFKRQLEQSEEAYNKYRNQKATVSLDEEAKLILSRTVDLQSKLMEARQKRTELISRYTSEHPMVKTVDEQIRSWSQELDAVNGKVRALPNLQQEALRLERDVKVNNELYSQLQNNSLQLQLIREGKIGNVRLIDAAAHPEEPVFPKARMILPIAITFGLLAGLLLALARNALARGVRNPHEVEAHTGLNVFGTIPLSDKQVGLGREAAAKKPGLHLLAAIAPDEPAVESLRSLSTALQFATIDAINNIILITGCTPGVGKSFVSANFAAVLTNGGKRVLLVDADMRKGHLNTSFGLERTRGLSEVLAGQLSPAQAIHKNVVPGLDFISTGVLPPNPAALVMNAAFQRVLKEVAANYDLVILDTPPVLAAADTLSVAPHVGTVLLVARAGQTQLGEIHESTKRLANIGKEVSGVLFNALDLKRRYFGSYGHYGSSYRYASYKYGRYSSKIQTD